VRNYDRCLQVDSIPADHGVKPFNRTRPRTQKMTFSSHTLWVADLTDIIASKRAAARPRDKAVLDILEKTLREKNRAQ